MRVAHLSLTNFRNYTRLEADLPAGPLILVGDNAQGKTSLLEAIYYLATASSPHATTDRQLIHWLAMRGDARPYLKIVAEVHTALEIRRVDIRVEVDEAGAAREPRLKKTVLINGLKRRAGDLHGAVNVVLFLPQDMALVEGSPSDRRRYLDATLCQVDPVYALALGEYGKILSQRNALLKQLQERNGNGAAELEFWDAELCRHGGTLIAARAQAIEEIERLAAPIHRELTEGAEHLRLAYQPAFDPLSDGTPQLALGLEVPVTRAGVTPEAIAENLRRRLAATRREEIERGATLTGPHRDDLRFMASGIDLGIYGSRGQGRTAVLSLKLAEMAWMTDRAGEPPILLLDEVLAELDPRRRRDLLSRIGGAEQSVMTTTDLSLFEPEFVARGKVWQVSGGTIQMENGK
ncbi:MAG: DNA replication/repair protein RecF [Chloroflexi bacterium]|nr:DNA replication/repair protein RecF [Chloroflexota bacterium]